MPIEPVSPRTIIQRAPFSNPNQAFGSKKCKQRQKRKAKDGEMITLDRLEQMDPPPLELIAADAGGDRATCLVQICFDFAIAQPAHVHARNRNMLEKCLAVARDGNGGIKFVAMAGKRAQLLKSLQPAGRLVEYSLAQGQGLVRANDIAIRPSAGNRQRLLAGKQCGDIAWSG